MKLLIIGLGGIGSYFISEVIEAIEQGQLDMIKEISIADDDMVELKQIKYMNYEKEEAGLNKAEVLSKRYKDYGIKGINKRITSKDIKPYHTIILCVDNEYTREDIILACHKLGKEFLDLRATGRNIFFMGKEEKLGDNIKFVDIKDLNEYSCQDKADLGRGWIQKGNKISAIIGVQMLLNLVRGHNNITRSEVI